MNTLNSTASSPKSVFSSFEEAYANMPTVIKRLSYPQASEHEKNMACFASLVVLSGIMTNVHGVYHQRKYYPNLFLIVLAAAASGKGTISMSRKLIGPIHDELIRETQTGMAAYKIQRSTYKQAARRDGNVSAPVRPPFRVALIPADITPSRFVQHLADANGQTPTILIDEEIDTSTASKKSYGDFSQILRKAASGETISLSRKGEDEYVECKEPKLALIMSGTFAQIKGLIQNAEDGLYSRSLFYAFDAGVKWQSVAPCPTCINLSDLYEASGREFYELYKFLQSSPTEVQLTEKQWQKLDAFGQAKLHLLYNFH